MSCPRYIVPPGFQIGAGPTGSVDCTAWAASRTVGQETCGAKVPSGRRIRRLTDEPIPDPKSPGLNLPQVADVITDRFGLGVDIRIGSRAASWDEYEERRAAGESAIVQLSYAPFIGTRYDAFGRRFRGGHAIAEIVPATYDSGADGRRPGIWRHDGTLYPRSLIREAAGELNLGGGATPGDGWVWCAFVGPEPRPWRVSVPARRLSRYWLGRRGRIRRVKRVTTRGIHQPCTPPRVVPWPGVGRRWVVQILGGPREGQWINARFAKEVTP